ncbi:HD domain-containing protein [soil metagenome]
MDRSRYKLFSDPVHGFVSVPKGPILDLIETPAFQRLRRIRQLGLGFLVFPGAAHSRFEHALGAMALMQEALQTIREKGTVLTTDEEEAALACALLHDIGHGPFSHTLENELIAPSDEGVSFHHEMMSRRIITEMSEHLGGTLPLALAIFDGKYDRPFLHTLISSQLDMDRLDYLRRDSFYTGVAEGVVGVDRIIKTLRVHPVGPAGSSDLVIEAKGAYAVESFLLSRRLMFWQVYLHKTVIAADHLLRSAIERARVCCLNNDKLGGSPDLRFFLERRVRQDEIDDPQVAERFARLDDTDVLYSMKEWASASDPILADLSSRFIDRKLFRTTYLSETPTEDFLADCRLRVARWLEGRGVASSAAAHQAAALYVISGTARLDAYQRRKGAVHILHRDGMVREISEGSDSPVAAALVGTVVKPYICAPREVSLPSLD